MRGVLCNDLKLKRGQRWENIKEGTIIEIVKVRSDFIISKNPFGGGLGHHITKWDLNKYWRLLTV